MEFRSQEVDVAEKQLICELISSSSFSLQNIRKPEVQEKEWGLKQPDAETMLHFACGTTSEKLRRVQPFKCQLIKCCFSLKAPVLPVANQIPLCNYPESRIIVCVI